MANAGVTHVRVPLLAFFGTNGDVGGQEDLDILTGAIQRQQLPIKVTTALIRKADHMYAGEEAQVADVISHWIDVR